jgi:hypothetical protein
MTIDTIKNEIKAKYPLVKMTDRKNAKNSYPRTLWISHGYYHGLISNDHTMVNGYNDFKEVMDFTYENVNKAKTSYK